MTDANAAVARCLQRVDAQRRRLLFVQCSAVAAALVTLVALTLGVGILQGWVPTWQAFTRWGTALAAVAMLAWAGVAVLAARSRVRRERLAAVIERAQPALMDRLNTLVDLETRRGDPQVAAFCERIERQASEAIEQDPVPSPFPLRRAFPHLAAFALALLFTFGVYRHWQPLTILRAVARQGPIQLPVLEEPAPSMGAYGEVRIPEPGRDVKVTRLDTVPLRIEATASDGLKGVDWFPAANGEAEQRKPLPAPKEPRFAVYEPEIALKGLGVQDWDVLSYHAGATTAGARKLESDLYFVNVLPLREDLEKLPGGRQGEAYALFAEMSGEIEAQEEVLRVARREMVSPAESLEAHRAVLRRLRRAEEDLSAAVQHTAARLAANVPQDVARAPAARLEGSVQALDAAGPSFVDRSARAGDAKAREAFAQMLAARKALQDAVRSGPEAFVPPDLSPRQQAEMLKEMARRQQEAADCARTVRALTEEQRRLAQEAAKPRPTGVPKLAERQEAVRRKLDEMQRRSPGTCSRVAGECAAAGKAASEAAQALRTGRGDAKASTGAAAEEFRKLSAALDRQARGQELAGAYRARSMLEQQTRTLEQIRRSPESTPPQQRKESASNLSQAAGHLKRTAEQSAARQCFSPGLRRSLGQKSERSIASSCSKLGSSNGAEARKAAGEAKAFAQSVARAFDQSRPSACQQCSGASSGRPSGSSGTQPSAAAAQAGARQGAQSPGQPSAQQTGRLGSTAAPQLGQRPGQQPGQQPGQTSAQRGPTTGGSTASRPADSLTPDAPSALAQGMRQARALAEKGAGRAGLSPEEREKLRRESLENLRLGLTGKGKADARARAAAEALAPKAPGTRPPSDIDPALVQRLVREVESVQTERAAAASAAKRGSPDLRHIDPSRFPPAYRDRLSRYYKRLAEQK